jgi:hypothetical protein
MEHHFMGMSHDPEAKVIEKIFGAMTKRPD